MKPNFLIVVLGFNRPASLTRLLRSLEQVEQVDCAADLLVSLDGGADPACAEVSEKTKWTHGKFSVVQHETRMGLKTHVESATDRVADFDAVIILEDDLSVSPWMLHYCREAYLRYGNEEQIAQISLYTHRINEFSGLPFQPAHSGDGAWFARVPSSWGQMYSRIQWKRYREWIEQVDSPFEKSNVPPPVENWKFSWKKYFYGYICATQRWVVYPFGSLTTNHGEVGQNYRFQSLDLEVPLEIKKRNYNFPDVDSSDLLYDEWLEPLPESLGIPQMDPSTVEVDLSGTKPLDRIKREYLLSSRACKTPIRQFSTQLIPIELNVRLQVDAQEGDTISLGKTEDFEDVTDVLTRSSRQVARAISQTVFESGVTKGHKDIRSGSDYRLGYALLSPFRFLRGLLNFSGSREIPK